MARHLRQKSTAKGKDRKKRRYAKESKADTLFSNVRGGFGKTAETAQDPVSSSEDSVSADNREPKHGVNLSPKIISFGGAKEVLQKNKHYKSDDFSQKSEAEDATAQNSGRRFREDSSDGKPEKTATKVAEAETQTGGKRFRNEGSGVKAEITQLNPQEAPKQGSGKHFRDNDEGVIREAKNRQKELSGKETGKRFRSDDAAAAEDTKAETSQNEPEKAAVALEAVDENREKNKGKRLKSPKEAEEEKKKSKEKFFSAENLPTSTQLEEELKRHKTQKDNSRLVRNTIFGLITVAAVAVLVATLFLPILQIYGTSMTPTLTEGDVVVSLKGSGFEQGDIISFYYNNKILVKRVIAFEGDFVNIDDDGIVFVNNKPLDEPYLTEKAFGECNLELPYQVPPGKIFVMGDHRLTSIDSRSSVMGCVGEEQIVGKIVFKVWPFDGLGSVK